MLRLRAECRGCGCGFPQVPPSCSQCGCTTFVVNTEPEPELLEAERLEDPDRRRYVWESDADD